MKRISIDPLTRLEGHGRVDIFLDEQGEVAAAYLVVPELRGFEKLCVGRPAEEMPRITSRICGICPEAHHLASAKTLDELFGVEPPAAARTARELLYAAFFFVDHLTHFLALGGPDFLLGAEERPERRSLFGVLARLGTEEARRMVEARARSHRAIQLLGGRSIHPVAALPGGWSVAVTEEMRQELEGIARANVETALRCLDLYERLTLGNQEQVALIVADAFTDRTYSMGTVDPANRPNFYDGELRVVDPDGNEALRFPAREYDRHIAERVEPWTFLKLPYLKGVGWNGLADGAASGVYATTPLARLNVADRMATPHAQEAFEKLYETLGSGSVAGRFRPIHHRLAINWARLVELVYAAERMLELAADPEVTDPEVRARPGACLGEAVGSVEAPRGTLVHHYWTDEQGIVTRVNLIVGTTNNHAPMALSLVKAARSLIGPGRPADRRLLDRIEMVLRAYDPCLACATHALPGKLPLAVTVRGADGTPLQRLTRETG